MKRTILALVIILCLTLILSSLSIFASRGDVPDSGSEVCSAENTQTEKKRIDNNQLEESTNQSNMAKRCPAVRYPRKDEMILQWEKTTNPSNSADIARVRAQAASPLY